MLKGKCALITGSTQGLGYAMAERLAAEGCQVVLNGFGDPAEIEVKRRRLEDNHGVLGLHHGADLGVPGETPPLSRRQSAPSGRSISSSTMPSSATSRHSRASRSRSGIARSR